MRIINYKLCSKCKGKLLCGKPYCPLLLKVNYKNKVKFKEELNSFSYELFVGFKGYPKVNVGIINYPKRSEIYFNYKKWLKNKFEIKEILNYRLPLVNASNKINVRKVNEMQLISLAKEPVNIEVKLKSKPRFLPIYSYNTPFGYYSKVEKYKVSENVKIAKPVEKVYYDVEMKAKDAIIYLYEKGEEIANIAKYLSSGSLGVKIERKFVPTRWSITAVDDIIASYLYSKIKSYKEIEDFKVAIGNLYGNYFYILLLPYPYSFDLLEVYLGGFWYREKEPNVNEDYELFKLRKNYALNTTGGYYASRLAVLQYLSKIKRQAFVIAIREITNEYYYPLGVWVVREACKIAFNKVYSFFSLNDAINFLKSKLKYKGSLEKSKLLRFYLKQRRIFEYK